MKTRVREAKARDLEAITVIYNQGIEDKVATMEPRKQTVGEMEHWLTARGPLHKVLVAEDSEGQVRGWASLNEFTNRCCYRGVADLSLYVERDCRRQGWGKLLASAIEEEARSQGFHKLVASCFSFNRPSLELARQLGFREVGTYLNHGLIDGKWVDVTILEKFLSPPEAVPDSRCTCNNGC